MPSLVPTSSISFSMFGRSIDAGADEHGARDGEHAGPELELAELAPAHEQERRERHRGQQPAPLHAARTAPKPASTGSAAIPPTASAAARARSGSS